VPQKTVKRSLRFLQTARPHWLRRKSAFNKTQNKTKGRKASKDRAAAERKIAATKVGPRLGWSRRERYGAVRARPGGAGAWWRAAADGAVPSPCSNAASSRARGRLVLSRNLASRGEEGMHLRGCKISRESCSEPDPRPPRGAAPAPGLTRVRGDGDRAPEPTGALSRRRPRAAHRRGFPPGGSDRAVAGSPSPLLLSTSSTDRPCAAAAAADLLFRCRQPMADDELLLASLRIFQPREPIYNAQNRIDF